MKELEDEADLLAAQLGQRVLVEPRDVDAVDRRPIRSVGASRPAIRPSSVDLPLPDGPTMATNWPAGMVVVSGWRMVSGSRAARHRLRHVVELDHPGGASPRSGLRTQHRLEHGQTWSATMRAPSAVG